MSKLRLLIYTLATVAFLLLLWVVPVVMTWIAIDVVNIMWIRIVLAISALLWVAVFRPWQMFAGERWDRLRSDLIKSFNALINK